MTGRHWHDMPTPSPDAARGLATPQSAATPRRRRLEVLLIEDNPGDVRLIRDFLSQAGGKHFKLTCADRLSAGLELLHRSAVDVVLLDLGLPDSSGLDTFLKARERAPGVPVVVLTGLDDQAASTQALRQGAEDYLVKGEIDAPLLARSLRYAIERNRRRTAEQIVKDHEADFKLARRIQQRLLPTEAPPLKGFDVSGATLPGHPAGASFFDYVRLRSGFGVVVGDVAGTGSGPAILMAETRAYVRTLAWAQLDLSSIVAGANHFLTTDSEADREVTATIVRIDPDQPSLEYTSAGYSGGYVLDAAGQVKTTLLQTGLPLGIDRKSHFPLGESVPLDPGDLLVVANRGFEEARSPDEQEFGSDRLLDVLRANRRRSAACLVDAMFEAVRNFAAPRPCQDDLTAVVLRVGIDE